jgi:hypothetical protein
MAAKTFSELFTDGQRQADELTGNNAANAKQIIKEGINESYSEVASIRDWETLENETTFDSVAGTNEYTPVTSSSTVPRIRRIISILDETNDKYIQVVKREIFEQSYPYVSTSEQATPTIAYVSGYTSNRDIKIKLYPVPNGVATYRVRFYEEPLELTADGDIPRIPDQYHYGLTYLGIAKYFEFQKDSIASYYRDLHKEFKAKILSNEWGDVDEMPQFEPLTIKKTYSTTKIGRMFS